jgi:hypothetical protein
LQQAKAEERKDFGAGWKVWHHRELLTMILT